MPQDTKTDGSPFIEILAVLGLNHKNKKKDGCSKGHTHWPIVQFTLKYALAP